MVNRFFRSAAPVITALFIISPTIWHIWHLERLMISLKNSPIAEDIRFTPTASTKKLGKLFANFSDVFSNTVYATAGGNNNKLPEEKEWVLTSYNMTSILQY